MDFGGVLDSGGVVVACSDTNTATPTTITTAASATATSNALFTAASEAVSDAETKQKWYGSVGFHKQERTSGANHAAEDDMRGSKMAKTTTATLPRSPFVGSEPHQMLSFSSSPYYPHASFGGNPGYGVAGLSGGNMHGVMSGVKGPFTPSQWMELEHQALIYKYITANVPIPPYLLNPIKKAIESAALSTFGLRVNSLGWGGAGGFHLGFSSNTDPEPGRCRRTDGKKWRCSRDAVADQKYCERHMNRGRHRSRKPVESPSGHPVSGTTTTAAAKLMPGASSTSSSSAAAAAVSGGGASNSLAFSHHNQLSNLQLPAATNPTVSAHHLDSRSFLDKEYVGERYQDPTGLSITSPILEDRQYSSIPKDQNPYEESSTLKFGLVCSDSLLNPLSKGSSLVSCRNYGTSEVVSDRENKSQHPIRQFMDNWPKNQSDRSMVLWPEIDMQQQSDSTQLSISIPMATSDFTSSTSSPANEKLNACPLKLSREIEATQMRLGVGAVINEQNQRQGNWIPIPWESSMGGPLGEVLHGTNSMASECKNPSALNLMTEGWDGSPKPASSPTGVLQKAVFYSISNSSAGSSPRAESNKNTNGASLCNEILGATLMNPSLPAL